MRHRDLDPQALKTARKNAGLSQPALARELDINVSTLRRWEAGRGNPNSENALALEAILHERLIRDRLFTPREATP